MPAPRFFLRPTVVALAARAQHRGRPGPTTTAEPAAAAASGTLSTVTVEASADASAEGLTKPYAGGQVARGGRVGILGNQDDDEHAVFQHQLHQRTDPGPAGQERGRRAAERPVGAPGARLRQLPGAVLWCAASPSTRTTSRYNGLYGMLPRQYIASEFFERVEVLRGANAFLNGARPAAAASAARSTCCPSARPTSRSPRIGFGVQTGGQGFVNLDLARRFGPDRQPGHSRERCAPRRRHRREERKPAAQRLRRGPRLAQPQRAPVGRLRLPGLRPEGRRAPSLTPSSTLIPSRARRPHQLRPALDLLEGKGHVRHLAAAKSTSPTTSRPGPPAAMRRSDEDNVLSNPTPQPTSFGNTSNTASATPARTASAPPRRCAATSRPAR